MSEYPEHDKLHAVKDESHAIGAFVEEFLSSKGIVLASTVEFEDVGERLSTISIPPIQKLLAEFYDIDYDELMNEKDQMLEAIRANH